MLEIKNVSVGYRDKKILEGINLSVQAGEFLLICGKSGSGKTTITKLINGIIPHYDECEFSGEVFVDGVDTKTSEFYEVSKMVSSVFQNPKTHFFNVNTTMELLFYLENIGCPKDKMKLRLKEMLGLFPISHLLDRSIFDLSGGEKQILCIAACYISGNDIIVLDEPSSNLDSEYTQIISEMLKVLNEKNITIIVSEHRLHYLKDLIDRAIYVKAGKIDREFSKEEFLSLTYEQRLQLGLRSIEKEELKNVNGDADVNNSNPKDSIKIDNIHCDFAKSNRGIDLKDLEIPLGSIVGIIGRNGIGKSTFVHSLIGVQPKSKVNVLLNNQAYSKKHLVKNSSLVMQDVNHQLFSDSVINQVTLGMKEIDEKAVDDVLNTLDLTEFKEEHPMSLSGGQKQRVVVASTILENRKIICFDEPTSGMDFANMVRISEIIKSVSKPDNVIFIISHDTEFLNLTADTFLDMKKFSFRTEGNMIQRLFNYAKDAKKYFKSSLAFLFMSTISWICSFIGAYFMINSFLHSTMNSDLFIKYSTWILISIVLFSYFRSIGLKHSHIFAYSTLGEMRKEFSNKMVKNPLGKTLSEPAGNYRQKIVDSIEQIELLLAHAFPEGIPYAMSTVLIIGCIFVVDYRLALLSLIPLIIGLLFMMRLFKHSVKKMQKYYESSKNMSSNIVEYISGIEVIKIFNQKDNSYKKLVDSVYNYRDYTLGWFRESWNIMAIVGAVAPTMSLFVIPFGVLMLKNGSLSLENLIFVSILCFSASMAISKLQFFMGVIAQINKKMDDLEKDFESTELKCGNEKLSDKFDIEYKGISFGYNDVEVIKDCSFSIKQSEKVAFVGESGSGKSTLVKLLMHYYDVNDGEILIGNKPITNLDLENLMENISYVSQDNFLFDMSIKDNILVGNPKATEEEFLEACKAANIHDVVLNFDDGYDTQVGVGGNKLSGGEMQRICIARAIIKNAPIVILDEATSFTDPENEYYINEALDKLCTGKTVIVIAHKLSRIVDMDKVILVDDGKVIAVGTHDELLENEVYNKLWNRFVVAKKFEFDVKEV